MRVSQPICEVSLKKWRVYISYVSFNQKTETTKIMKTLKKVLLISASIFLTISTFAQSRENKVNLKFDSKSEKLTTAVGWKLNKETGKWIDNKNVIEDRACPAYWVSYISQNFKWIQFSTIKHNGVDLYVLLYERQGGAYKYPNIKENWEPNTQTHFLVIDSTEYKKLQDAINNKEAKDIKISSKISGSMSDRFKILGGEHLYNEENLLAKITIALEKTGYSETCFIINSQKVDGVDVVRFRLPESCYSAEKDMKEAYFEAKLEEFNKILLK
jgi:hypothetical protein